MAAYDAFVSYSHAKDKPVAAALQSVIQKLGKPWYRRRALRLFRDDTSLSATPGLWPTIEQALGNSRYLILLTSPQAAASPWVNKEVAWWTCGLRPATRPARSRPTRRASRSGASSPPPSRTMPAGSAA
ncbi:MAG: TIR domain-containing protein [Alphaproteobacteria bacterium]|nr:MAG: TIR domain-containing protein [Alphaproteobacteria bacterium]